MPPPYARRAEAEQHQISNRPGRPAQAWLIARARLAPDLLSQSPPWVRSVFEHTWAPMEAMANQIRPFPQSVWDWLLRWDGGYVAICTGDSRYEPDPAIVRHRRVRNVAYVSIEDLAQGNDRPLHVIGHLLDHYLGCVGDADGPWLSEGGGVTPPWREAGDRLPRLFALGYGVDEIARTNVREYFAQSLALYCRNRERLNVADPQICKWFRSTLWNEAFWRDDGKRHRGKEG